MSMAAMHQEERLGLPDSVCPTLIDVLRWRAAREPDVTALALWANEGQGASYTYGELDQRARSIAALLQQTGTSGQRALLLYPPGLDFVAALLGCLYAGCVAVPAHPPDLARVTRSLARLRALVADARPTFVLTPSSEPADAPTSARTWLGDPALRWLATSEIDKRRADEWQAPAGAEDSLAFLQYTSGSTSSPRGVRLSHANLLHNLEFIRSRFEGLPDQPVVSWLPPYHDMGLVGGILTALYAGSPLTLMSPLSFLKRPVRWLEAISRTGAVISGGPHFAYDVCVRRISAAERAPLDLSRWKLAFTGAEPLRAATFDLFAETFKECGFGREAFFPCYGLAEATLMVCGGCKSEPPVVLSVRRDHLEKNLVTAARPGEPGAVALVGCGRSAPDQSVVIVDPETLLASPDGAVGEIWVRGPSVALGYWDRPEESHQTFMAFLADDGRGPYLRTGDLGFLENGELFVTGRLQDLIVCAGRNHYPEDIEQTVEVSHDAVLSGCSVAFSVPGAHAAELAIAAEVALSVKSNDSSVHRRRRRSVQALCPDEVERAIRRGVSETHDLSVRRVLLLRPGAIPRTSSGKVQRQACRAKFLSGGFAGAALSQDAAVP